MDFLNKIFKYDNNIVLSGFTEELLYLYILKH